MQAIQGAGHGDHSESAPKTDPDLLKYLFFNAHETNNVHSYEYIYFICENKHFLLAIQQLQ